MEEQLAVNMKDLILTMFTKIPGLREGYCLQPRWFMLPEIMNLNELEKNALEAAFDKLSEEGIIEITDNNNAMGAKIAITNAGVELITKNKLKGDEVKDKGSINIGNLHADNVQVGNENTMNINITPDEFIGLLETLNTKPEPEKRSIFNKLADFVKSGLSIGELIIKLKGLL